MVGGERETNQIVDGSRTDGVDGVDDRLDDEDSNEEVRHDGREEYESSFQVFGRCGSLESWRAVSDFVGDVGSR